MKYFAALLLLLVTRALNAQTAEETSLLEGERKRSEAIANHNSTFLFDLYHHDFYGVTPVGVKVDKRGILDLFNSFKSELIFGPEEMTVKIFATSAVVGGLLVGRTKSGEMVSRSMFMHFYNKVEGRWIIVAGQGAVFPERK